ncbi:MAG: TlpA disulfide reductase family protein [Dysgonomonas sp.]|nr:TlpA disulfide reductase family protein [Dysgonomonas sp.]
MKYRLSLFLSFFVVLSILSSEKKDFIIEGKIGDLSAPATIFLLYNDPVTNHTVRDSTLLNAGRFTFTGRIEYPVYVQIIYAFNGDIRYATGGDIRRFYLEAGKITIDGYQLFNAEIKGSVTQDLLERYFDIVRPVQKKMREVRNNMDDIYIPYSPEYRLSLDSLYKSLNEEYNQLSMDFIEAHPNSMLAIDMLDSEVKAHPDNDKVEILYEQLSQEMKGSVPGIRLKRNIQNRKRIGTGHVAPNFRANTLDGNSVSLSDYKGKWLLLVFWSPTCDICHREAQELIQVYKKYKEKGFEILAFAIEGSENKHKWEKVVSDLTLLYTTVSDLKEWSSPIVQQYKINAVPENYLINPDGLIYGIDLYGYALTEKLGGIFKK